MIALLCEFVFTFLFFLNLLLFIISDYEKSVILLIEVEVNISLMSVRC